MTAASLHLKLKERAARLGLVPGSSQWCAYVLGTPARARAIQRRKQAKQKRKDKGP